MKCYYHDDLGMAPITLQRSRDGTLLRRQNDDMTPVATIFLWQRSSNDPVMICYSRCCTPLLVCCTPCRYPVLICYVRCRTLYLLILHSCHLLMILRHGNRSVKGYCISDAYFFVSIGQGLRGASTADLA